MGYDEVRWWQMVVDGVWWGRMVADGPRWALRLGRVALIPVDGCRCVEMVVDEV